MENKVISKVFLWMFIGLFVTFLTGYVISTNEKMLISVFSTSSYIIFSIIEIVLVIILSARIKKLKPTTCRIFFLLYSFISGLTFSSIFIAYSVKSIIYVFLVSAIIFGLFSLIGYTTKINLNKVGIYLMMALFGIIICSIINVFVGSQSFDLFLSGTIILIFMGITAYDIQKIKNIYTSTVPKDNLAIYGALQLYLDYINIFLNLLRLFTNDR